MAAKKTIRKAVCDKCGDVKNNWYTRRKHGYAEDSCGGTYVEQELPKEVITGEFEFVKSYGNQVYIKHVESGRELKIYTADLLKVLAGRGLGKLIMTESKRGTEPCWKAQEVDPSDNV